MTQHLPIWYLGNIDPVKCDELIKQFDAQANNKASMGIEGDKIDDGYRDTSLVFLPFDHPFGIEMTEHAMIANNACKWDYEINMREAVQFARYGVNQHYNWHVDIFPLSGKETDRKVTVVVLLNDPSEFEGGEFQIRLYSEYAAPLSKGSMIAFPSTLEHRVTPVTKGVRYSATVWTAGPRFK